MGHIDRELKVVQSKRSILARSEGSDQCPGVDNPRLRRVGLGVYACPVLRRDHLLAWHEVLEDLDRESGGAATLSEKKG